MKTLIELYVNEQYDNLLAAYVFKPQRVVFVCTDVSPDKQTRQSMLNFLKGVRNDIEVEFVYAGNKLADVLFDKMAELALKYPDCAVEMSGGSTAALVAAQSFCYKHKINAFYFDHSRDKFISIRGMKRQLAGLVLPRMDTETILKIGGACVTGTGHSIKPLAENAEVVRGILGVYSRDLADWNANSEYLQYCCKHYYDGAARIFYADAAIHTGNSFYMVNRRIMRELESVGAITELSFENDSVFFRFKNSFIKELLTTVGMCLELLIYIGAKDCGSFDDVDMSVVFDWDGITHSASQDTVNEIDVVMTRGLSPIFVSCKSARPDTRDLYEIWYLAHRFGGKRAKAVIATAVPLSSDSWATYVRAKDMGIIVIERSDLRAYDGGDWLHDKLLCPMWLEEKPPRGR